MLDGKTLRWGIVSAGAICHDFCVALDTLPSDEHVIEAVAARELQRAQDFAKKHGAKHAFGSYEELAKFPDVDVAYIGVLNRQHFEVCMMMLSHGKHVLCEKPLCMNQKQARKLIQYAESKKLFLMEAVWSRFFPAYQYLRKEIETGILGEIQQVEVSFGTELANVERMRRKDLGGGTTLDLGVYNIQCAQWAFRELPKSIEAKGTLNDDGVDIETEVELVYTGNRKALLRVSGERDLDNKAVIKGTKGEITLPQFWSPNVLIDIDGSKKEWPVPEGRYPTNFPNSVGLRYEAMEVRQCILQGVLQSEHVSHNDSLLFAQIEDEIRKKLGVKYPEDD